MEKAKTRFRIGFTGTRKGMTPEQVETVKKIVAEELKPERLVEGHHGSAVGADAQFHEICLSLEIPVVLHPPTDDSERAECPGAKVIYPPQDHKERDQTIVNLCQILIAAPMGFKEQIRGSGTWTTIRYARKNGTRLVIVFPDGSQPKEK